MIPKLEFGRTGHLSTRILFGAAALGGVTQTEADKTLELASAATFTKIGSRSNTSMNRLSAGVRACIARLRGPRFDRILVRAGQPVYRGSEVFLRSADRPTG